MAPKVNLKRIWRTGLINLFRAPVVSLASIITLSAVLFIIGSLMIGTAFLNALLEKVKDRFDISVSFRIDVDEEKVLALRDALVVLPEARSVVYSSREQELEDFKERHKNNHLILQSLSEVGNPFGARLNIQAVDPGRYQSIVNFLESDVALDASGAPLIDQISYKKNIVDRLVSFIAAIQRIGVAIISLMLFISVVVIFNTISLAIYSSREEIGIMKLVGAGDNYVRGPFLFQGALFGLVAALIALALIYPVTLLLRSTSGSVFGGIDLVSYFFDNLLLIAGTLVAAGVILGVIPSFWAVRRHLKI